MIKIFKNIRSILLQLVALRSKHKDYRNFLVHKSYCNKNGKGIKKTALKTHSFNILFCKKLLQCSIYLAQKWHIKHVCVIHRVHNSTIKLQTRALYLKQYTILFDIRSQQVTTCDFFLDMTTLFCTMYSGVCFVYVRCHKIRRTVS